MSIKGKLIIVGGGINTAQNIPSHLPQEKVNEDDFYQNGILKKIIEESKLKENSRIEIVTTASQSPKIAAESYIRAFKLLNAHNVEHLDINTRADALNIDFLKRLDEADVVLFSGGDQLRLTSTIGGTPFQQKLLQKYYHEEFIYAGTSAGAAAASSSMIYQGDSVDALLKGAVEMNSGLGLIDSIIVDTHFIKRGRIGRLFQAVTGNPMKIGIGLSEDTGLIISITYLNANVMTRNYIFHFDENKIIIKDSQYNNQ